MSRRVYIRALACVRTHMRTRATRIRVRTRTHVSRRVPPLSLFLLTFVLYRALPLSVAPSPYLPALLSVVDIRTARSNITIRSQTNSLAMPGRLPFTGRTVVVSPV